MTQSKFSKIFQESRPTCTQDSTTDSKREPQQATSEALNRNSSIEAKKKRLGRPRGKRSNPEYEQVTAYIPTSLYTQVKLRLIEQDRKEFSTLVEELLNNWIQKKRN